MAGWGDLMAQAKAGTAPSPTPAPAAIPTAVPSTAPSIAQDTSVLGNIGAGALAGVNSLAFGIPEWVYKKVGGDEARKQLENYIAAHKTASTVGDIAGMVGGALIPGGAIARGIGMAGKAAKAGTALAKLGQAAGTAAKAGEAASKSEKLLSLIGKGALAGGAEGAVRGATGNEGNELQGALQGAQSGALFGAGGGALAGAIANVAPRVLKEAEKTGKQAYLGMSDMNRRQAMGILNDMAGPGAKGLGRKAKDDEALDKMYDYAVKYKLPRAGMDDVAADLQSERWKKINDAFSEAHPDTPAADLINLSTKADDLAFLGDMPGGDVALASLEKIGKDTANIQGIHPLKTYLNNAIKDTFSQSPTVGENAAQAQRALLNTIRSNLDDYVTEVAEKQGVDRKMIEEARAEYLPARAFAESAARKTVSPTKTNLGSPTLEKFMMSGGGAALGMTQGDDMGTRLRNAAVGGTLGFGAKKIAERAIQSGVAHGVPVVKALGNVAGKVPPAAAAVTAGGLAGSLAAPHISAEPAAVAETVKQAEASPEHAAAFAQRLDEGYKRSWLEDTKGMMGPADESNPQYVEYRSELDRQLRDQGQSKTVNPKLAANVLFSDPAQKADYLKALEASKTISENFDAALPAMGHVTGAGMPFFGNPEAVAKKAAILEAAKSVGGNAKVTEESVNKILNGSGTKQEKLARIMDIMRGNNPAAMEALGLVGAQ